MYNFVDLIRRHSVPFELVSNSGGSYIDGKWKNGLQTISARFGAIIPLPERKIYSSGGTYTSKDRNLFMSTPITSPLKETQVRYKGDLFNIEEETDYSDYSAAFIYVLRWVSAVSDKPKEEQTYLEKGLADVVEVDC